MKKLLTLVVSALMIMTFAVATQAADISVTLNGEALVFEQAPVIVEGRTLVPLRAIFEALGASVEWDGDTKTVTSVKDDITVKLTIGSNVLYKNDEAVELDVPAQIVGAGYTMVPARAIAESFGVLVDWDDSTKTVILVKEETVIEEKDENVLINLTGENYVPADDIKGGNVGLSVVDNPDRPGDKVLYVETDVADKAHWNYFWHPATWEPGQKYLITFSIRGANDTIGNPVMEAAYGINVYLGKDNGVSTNYVKNQKWYSIAFIYTVPADADPNANMKFGIYANPIGVSGFDHTIAWSYYLDNLYVAKYDGEETDGLKDPSKFAPPNGSGVPAGFDYKTAGVSLDLTDGVFGSKGYGEVVDGVVSFKNESTNDPMYIVNAAGFNLAEYKAVAVKYKKYETGNNAASMQVFFATDSDSAWTETKGNVQAYNTALYTADGSYISYFDFSQNANWFGTLTKLRVDPGNDHGFWDIEEIILVKA